MKSSTIGALAVGVFYGLCAFVAPEAAIAALKRPADRTRESEQPPPRRRVVNRAKSSRTRSR